MKKFQETCWFKQQKWHEKMGFIKPANFYIKPANFYLQTETRIYWKIVYLFKVNNRNTRKMSEICSNLTIKTRWRSFGVFFVYFKQTLHLFLVFLLLTLLCWHSHTLTFLYWPDEISLSCVVCAIHFFFISNQLINS